MKKSYLLALCLGLVLAKTCSAVPVRKANSYDDDDDESSESEEESDSEDESDMESDEESDEESEEEFEENPSPSCLLFGNKGCHVECTIIAQTFDIKAKGHCNEYQTCQCHISSDMSFYDRWEKVFDDDYVYRKISENRILKDQARRIFSFPLRTATEFKQLLKPILSPYQFSKLKINEDSATARFTKKDGDGDKIDQKAVQKYVSQKVAKLVNSSGNKSLLNTKYKQKFQRYLVESDGAEGTLYNLTFRVHQLNNNALREILKEYFEKEKLKEPRVNYAGDEDLAVTVVNAVMNEIMKLNDEKKTASDEKDTAQAKKSIRQNTAKYEPAVKPKRALKAKPAT